MGDGTDTGVVMLSLLAMVVIGAAAVVPAYAVWATAPTVAGEVDFYVRLGAAIVVGVAGAFTGGFVLTMAVNVGADLAEGMRGGNNEQE